MKPNFKDKRGTITDLIVNPKYSVTHITFTKNAVRGNHYHKKTLQVDLVLKGRFLISLNGYKQIVKQGDYIKIPKGMKHAYKALESSTLLSVCHGVRRGTNYEKDVFRLKTPLL